MTGGLELVTPSAEDTRRVAATVAAALRPGDVVALSGELGAGKTCFVQGAARTLGVTDRVTSPSFLLRRDYAGRVPVVHFDVYRLDTLQDVLELGYDDVVDGDGVTFIEWGDAMTPLLPPERLSVELRHVWTNGEPASDDGAEPRRLCLRPHGDGWTRRLAALAGELRSWTVRGAG